MTTMHVNGNPYHDGTFNRNKEGRASGGNRQTNVVDQPSTDNTFVLNLRIKRVSNNQQAATSHPQDPAPAGGYRRSSQSFKAKRVVQHH